MNDKDKIKKLISEIDKSEIMEDRKTRLKKLVDDYGYENVSLASGLTVASILQYTSSKSQMISLEKLTQAELVLRQL